ncbi:hydroxyacylglutathione hydrolase [Sphingomonas ginkgonis]|uniref:Hydroxyacylglutathione hydrolase n=1 Tax=Sphingomonas ginkgonis TaxID=2315330 RepID=A0A429VDF2_9SPHN|nr:hydroxyacylglutathione hydrolase [Sphingomonas ginkgonis]RST32055.1 hydroxyacylglutathione hydrolase [Sphingomonas ginkgonis]
MRAAEVVALPAFSDNYIWLLRDPETGEAAVIDPGDGAVALAGLKARGWQAKQIFNTHWHPDHVGGNAEVKAATGCTITAPAAEAARIPAVDRTVAEGDRVQVGALDGEVWEVPGHTLGHIAYVFREAGIAFVGDTLFAMGCGRLFEGTPEQMYASLQRLAALPGETRVYAAHEYTLSNARFATHVMPEMTAITDRLTRVEADRAAGKITLPTTIAEERDSNPFVRAGNAAEFGRLRAAKDSYRS